MSKLARWCLPLLAGTVMACSDEDGGTNAPPPDDVDALTVDASTGFAFVRLGDPAAQVSVSDPQTSMQWDLGVFATTVTLNGGGAGPGDDAGYCVCQNAGVTDAQIQTLTAPGELADFEAVDEGSIPDASGFEEDRLVPIVEGWFTGSGAGAAANPARSWIVALGSTGLLAKFHVTALTGGTATGPASVTIEYGVQSAPGAAFGAPTTATFDLSSGPVAFNFVTGAPTSGADWHVRFEGFTVTINGGVSGTGNVRAVPVDGVPFAAIDAAFAGSVPPTVFQGDQFGGVFAESPWFRYNVTGTDNQIWPTFDVYLIRRGDEVWKVQLTGYYDAAANPRNVSFRYARLR